MLEFKGLWVNLAKDELFCLLGHNGAGKTTAMNCLTGITTITGGDGNIQCLLFLNPKIIVMVISYKKNSNFCECPLLITALIYGHSIRSSIDMLKIRKLMGVCPQVNFFSYSRLRIIWLSPIFGHLRMFGDFRLTDHLYFFTLISILSLLLFGMNYLEKSILISLPTSRA